jgi:histidinol phosphatase-like PHP family hydrolase
MPSQITREMLNNCYNLKNEFKDLEYKQQIKKYVDDVINVISLDMINNLNPHPNVLKKYVYTIGNNGIYKLLNHPQLPDIAIKRLNGLVYRNEIEKIYPIDELMDGLKEKFPDSKIILNLNKTAITIDWS